MIKREVSTPLQLIKIRIPAKEMLPNLVKQKGGFPPNFIHSLDSCHMMLTALYCQKQGLTFTSVHDSFWTHACDVDMMNKVLDEFIPQFSCLFYKRLHISTIYTKYLLLHQFTWTKLPTLLNQIYCLVLIHVHCNIFLYRFVGNSLCHCTASQFWKNSEIILSKSLLKKGEEMSSFTNWSPTVTNWFHCIFVMN